MVSFTVGGLLVMDSIIPSMWFDIIYRGTKDMSKISLPYPKSHLCAPLTVIKMYCEN